MKKKILFLNIYGGKFCGGTEIYLKNLLKEIKKRGKREKIYIACFNKKESIYAGYADEIIDTRWTRFLENEKVIGFYYRFFLAGFLSFLWGGFWLYQVAEKIVKKNRIDLIYANGGRLSAMVAYFLAKKFRIKYILHFHGFFGFSDKSGVGKLTQDFLNNADKVIANSEDVARDIEGVKGFNKKCIIVKCFVDKELFYPRDKRKCREKLSYSLNDFIVVSYNRFEKDKRIDFLIESVKRFQNEKLRVIFIGEGSLKNEIIELSKNDRRVKYFPFKKNEELSNFINAADVCWGAASVNYLSLSAVESLACGVPVLVSEKAVPIDAGWGRKVDKKTVGKAGFIVKEDYDYMEKLLDRLIKERKKLEKKKRTCLEFYEKEYGEENIKKVLSLV